MASASLGGVGGFTPAQLPGLTLDLNPALGFVANTTWVDQAQGLAFSYSSGSGSTAAAGTGINGRPTVDLTSGGHFASASLLSAILSAAHWTALVVFRYTGAISDTGIPYTNPGIITDLGAYFWQTVSTTKLHAGQYDGAAKDDATTIATSTNYYALSYYDGTKVRTSLNGGAFDSGVSAASVQRLDHSLVLGSNYAVNEFFVGSLGRVIVWNQDNSASAPTISAWASATWGI